MFQFMRGIALVAAMLLGCGASFAGATTSANLIMQGCRVFFAKPAKETIDDAFLQGECLGIVDAVLHLAEDNCPPKGSTPEQAIRIVVKHIDDRPARMHEPFIVLAREALRAAWPCKK
jgi:hypothetical protein